MTPSTEWSDRRLRIAGTMLIAGLLVEGICLLWARPLAFILLATVGGTLCIAGMAVYLYSVFFRPGG